MASLVLSHLAMLVWPGGMERTQEDYEQLMEAAGFRLTRIVPFRTGWA
jgi:hypothetical protein